ncbi:hypothetical protein D3C71_2010700 [compost metagenome]
MNCAFNVVIVQRVAGIDIQYRIDIETLTEFVFLVKDAVVREECAIHDTDCVHGHGSYFEFALLCRIASATASASLLKATL